MDLKSIITQFLDNRHYDGLFNPVLQCACKLGDLFPCIVNIAGGGPREDCEAGDLTECTGEGCDGDCEFHIGRRGGLPEDGFR